MKQYFIFNPVAGAGKKGRAFLQDLEEVMKYNKNIHLYVTKGVGDATDFVNELAIKHKDEDICVYACGGDGTTFEVINGIVGHDNVLFGIVPTGSCNDFLKSYQGYDFLDLNKQLEAKEQRIDCIKVNDTYCLNVTNIGFDARVNYDQIVLRSKCKSIKQAYNKAILKNLVPFIFDNSKVYVDDKLAFEGKTVLMALANGSFYGGGYNCAPYAKVDDGIIDIVIVKKMSALPFAILVKKFKAGLHLDNKQCLKHIFYTRGKKIKVVSDETLCITIDGETFHKKEVNLTVLPKKIRFLVPKN